ncbi:MAG: sensor histidine kinase [Clostridiales Family XIII bacterium]|jgi:signal transduction histidine kinase|nr:sensor histidine kinase [Clostridiales Family XIII bacterium]
MSGLSFLKDKMGFVFTLLLTVIFGFLILSMLNCPLSLILSVSGLYLLGGIIALLYEYTKKRVYYNHLLTQLSELPQKRLISEIMEPPTFCEGVILWDVLKAANKSMNDEVARLEKANREYREYVELWVHEIKTPISGVRLICDNNGYDEVADEVEKIEKYVEQALFYARSESVERDYAIQTLDVHTFVGGVIKRNAKYLIARKIKIEHHAEGRVYADPKWLEFILQQILDNAVKYGAKTIVYSFENNTLMIKDDGVGIPQKDLPRVFERGFTGENGRKTARSTGMGLYLCKRLCEKLGLGIAVSSEGGTAVSITFPVNPYTTFM